LPPLAADARSHADRPIADDELLDENCSKAVVDLYERQTMAVFADGAWPRLRATRRSIVMLLGGQPVGERHIWWNFVSSRTERIEQAKADWSARRIPLPPADSDEFIPLP
jgi:hypothetical protein